MTRELNAITRRQENVSITEMAIAAALGGNEVDGESLREKVIDPDMKQKLLNDMACAAVCGSRNGYAEFLRKQGASADKMAMAAARACNYSYVDQLLNVKGIDSEAMIEKIILELYKKTSFFFFKNSTVEFFYQVESKAIRNKLLATYTMKVLCGDLGEEISFQAHLLRLKREIITMCRLKDAYNLNLREATTMLVAHECSPFLLRQVMPQLQKLPTAKKDTLKWRSCLEYPSDAVLMLAPNLLYFRMGCVLLSKTQRLLSPNLPNLPRLNGDVVNYIFTFLFPLLPIEISNLSKKMSSRAENDSLPCSPTI
jgi:hypothetical protein